MRISPLRIAFLCILATSAWADPLDDPEYDRQQAAEKRREAAQERSLATKSQAQYHNAAAQFDENAAIMFDQAAQRATARKAQELNGSAQDQQQQIQNSFNKLGEQIGQTMRNKQTATDDSANPNTPRQPNDEAINTITISEPHVILDQNSEENLSNNNELPPNIVFRNREGTEEYGVIPDKTDSPIETTDPEPNVPNSQTQPTDDARKEFRELTDSGSPIGGQSGINETSAEKFQILSQSDNWPESHGEWLDFPSTKKVVPDTSEPVPPPPARPPAQDYVAPTVEDMLGGPAPVEPSILTGKKATTSGFGDSTPGSQSPLPTDVTGLPKTDDASKPAELDLESWHALSLKALDANRQAMQDRAAAAKLEEGVADINAHANEGIQNARLSQIGAGGQALQAAGEIGAEFVAPEIKYTFKTVKAVADLSKSEKDPDILANEAKSFSNFKQIPSQSTAPEIEDAKVMGKAADGLSLVSNLKKGTLDGGIGAVKDFSSIAGYDTAKKVAVTANAGSQIIGGVTGVVEGGRITGQIEANAEDAKRSLQVRADQLKADAAEKESLKAYYDSILLPSRN